MQIIKHLKKIVSGVLVTVAAAFTTCVLVSCSGKGGNDGTDNTNDEYKLVWSEEFDAADTLAENWTQEALETHASDPEKNPNSDILRTRGSDNAFVRDGELVLVGKAHRDPNNVQIKFSTPDSVTTKNTMNFRYGYLEMRARVPYMRGAWPSFWTKSDGTLIAAGEAVTHEYLAEVDIFEVFANEYGWMAPNVHKWGCYGDDTVNYWGQHDTVPTSTPPQYYFVPNENTTAEAIINGVAALNSEYHTYGLKWTETELVFYVDRVEYFRTGITDADDFGFKYPTGMGAFHDALYINLNNYVYSPELIREICRELNATAEYAAEVQRVAGIKPEEEAAFYSEYCIDYIRLYQTPAGKVWKKN